MSQHSQRTQNGPSLGMVVTGAVAIAISAAASVYLVTGPGVDPRKVVAVILGSVLTGLLTIHLMGLVAERAVVRDRAARAAERERDIEEYERELAARERDLAARQHEWRRAEPRYEDRQEPQPVYEEPRHAEPEPEPVDAYGRTWAEAWRVYRDNHPEVLASWGQQNGRWPNCPGPECNPGQDPVAHEVDVTMTRYLDEEPRYEDRQELDPAGYPREEGPVVYPAEPTLDQTRSWLASPVDGPPYDEVPVGYEADPARPWKAFDPVPPRRAALGQVAMPLPPRDGYADPDGSSDRTEVMTRIDPDVTEVIERVQS